MANNPCPEPGCPGRTNDPYSHSSHKTYTYTGTSTPASRRIERQGKANQIQRNRNRR